MIDRSLITCPHCDTAKLERMPTDACQFFYNCTGCGTRLKPSPETVASFARMAPSPVHPSRRNVIVAATNLANLARPYLPKSL